MRLHSELAVYACALCSQLKEVLKGSDLYAHCLITANLLVLLNSALNFVVSLPPGSPLCTRCYLYGCQTV